MLPLILSLAALVAAVAYCTIAVHGLWRDTHEDLDGYPGDWKLSKPVRK